MDQPPPIANQVPTPPAKPRRRRWPWIVLGVIIIVPLLFLGWTGLWNIPVVTALFGTNKPIDLGVRVSNEALQTALRDNPMTFVGDTSTWYGMGVKRYTGSVPIDDVHSSEEVTSFINLAIGSHRYARDIQVKFVPGGLEVSAFVVPKIKAPVYAKVDVTQTGPKSVRVTVERAKVGRLTVPSSYYDDIANEIEKFVNARMAEADGLAIETLEYRANEAYLKATLPQTIEQVPGQEYTIAGTDLRTL